MQVQMQRWSLCVSIFVTLVWCFSVSNGVKDDALCNKTFQYFDTKTNVCKEFKNPYEKVSTDYSTAIDSGNTAWMLSASALVMIMTPGLAFFYAGLAGEEMTSNTIMMSFVSAALVSIQYFIYGYSISFNPETLFGWAAFKDVSVIPSGVYGEKIPSILFAFFKTQFAAITPALISGGIIGRVKFGSYIIFIFLWSTFVYLPLARWMWSLKLDENYTLQPNGWEAKMGSIDFSGATVIHVASGFAALVAAIVVGRRYNHDEPVRPHNVPLVMIGCTLLWFGWFGFNAGSAGAANGVAAIAAVNTHLSACAGFLVWILLEYIFDYHVNPCGGASGAVAGLASIAPGCGYVEPWTSLIFGAVGAIVAFAFVRVKNKLRYDDTLDTFAVHGCAGFAGGILTGCFATTKVNPNGKNGAFYGNASLLWHNLVSQLIAAAYSVVVTFVLLIMIKYTIGLRLEENKERSGIDQSYHGGNAYNNSITSGPMEKSMIRANSPSEDFITSSREEYEKGAVKRGDRASDAMERFT